MKIVMRVEIKIIIDHILYILSSYNLLTNIFTLFGFILIIIRESQNIDVIIKLQYHKPAINPSSSFPPNWPSLLKIRNIKTSASIPILPSHKQTYDSFGYYLNSTI